MGRRARECGLVRAPRNADERAALQRDYFRRGGNRVSVSDSAARHYARLIKRTRESCPECYAPARVPCVPGCGLSTRYDDRGEA